MMAGVAGVILGDAAQAQVAAPTVATNTAAPTVVLATLRVVNKESMKVAVTAYDGTKLFYRDPSEPAGASISIPAASLDRFSFEITLDEEELGHALMDQNWNRVCILLWPVVSPLLPYAGIKNNNGVDLAMTLGNSLMKAANLMRAAKGGDEEKANRIVQRAYSVYAALGAAEWYPESEAARLKGILCLITLKNPKQAERDLRKMRVPEIGDQTMGLYWYTLAVLREANGDNREAMNAVVKSIAFENKDIEVFPEALMMSGRLYEALLDPYRARDVYFEVARLFPDTDWAKVAKIRLQYILDQKLTHTKEVLGIEQTFFGMDEDVNTKASSLLKGTLDMDKPDAEESVDADTEESKPEAGAAADSKAGDEVEAAKPPAPAPVPAPKPGPIPKPAKKGTPAHAKP